MNSSVRLVLTTVLFFVITAVTAQPALEKMQQKLAAEKQNTTASYYKFELNSKMKTQAGVLFSPDMAVPKAGVQAWLADKLALRSGVDAFLQKGQPAEYAGTQISKLQQYYKGIKVEHGVISQVSVNNRIRLLQMEFYSIPSSLPTSPVISEDAALRKAMEFAGARQYVWENNITGNPEYAKPHGELVIVEDIFSNISGKMCLAYKFDVFAAEPASRQFIYVDVLDGKVVFSDVVIKHLDGRTQQQGKSSSTNTLVKQTPEKKEQPSAGISLLKTGEPAKVNGYAFAKGFTRYSGDQNFITEEVSPTLYRLRAQSSDNNTVYQTYNANHKAMPNISPADITDFTDNDNNWTELSYIDDTTYAALDVHWGVEQVIDYWWKVHNRKSYDNNNGQIISFFHYGVRFGGAFWNGQGKSMFYGDGSQDGQGFNALTSVDVTAHEIGHGICDFTAGLVYKRESGALNEGFSDIWAACIDNYVNKSFPSLSKVPFKVADEIVEVPGRDCLRDMAEPGKWGQPDTYMDTNTTHFWHDASAENCPTPIHQDSANGNDFCGVHANSGVLNKWFYLVTHGQVDFKNGNGETYTIDSMGFDKTEKIAYYTEMILTPNSGYEAAKIASLNAVLILASTPNTLGITAADTINIARAWKAVGVTSDSIYNMTNIPIFASNQFTSIAVGQRGYIWAGTSNNGLYKYDGKTWQKAPNLTNHNIAQILPDRNGGIWIAQYGRTGTQAIAGGIGYYADTSFTYQQFSNSDGVPTRNVKSVFINNALDISHKYQRVWAACFADVTAGVTRPGAVTRGLEIPVPPQTFDKIVTGVYQVNGFCQATGGNKDEVWVFASSNTASNNNQILRYRTSDTAFLGVIDNNNVGAFPVNFTAKAIYYDDVKKRWWIGLLSGGLVVRDSATHTWMVIDFSAIFPSGIIVNNNAITGDTRGNIYIGTNKGYVFFGSPNASVVLDPLDVTQYKRYTRADGLPSDSIRAVTIDYRAGRILLATDNGIAFKYTLCRGCINTGPVYSIMPGNWSNPGIWASGEVPGLNANVVVKHAVVVTQDANCNSLKVQGQGNVTVNTGVKLNVEAADYNATGIGH